MTGITAAVTTATVTETVIMAPTETVETNATVDTAETVAMTEAVATMVVLIVAFLGIAHGMATWTGDWKGA